MVYRLPDFELVHILKDHTGSVWTTCFSPEGFCLVSGSDDGSLKVYGVPSFQLERTLNDNSGFVRTACFSPDGSYFAAGDWDKLVNV
mmetsp:Transcript_38802/g.32752  ORF Transcript_38802/g.32752 Transcript_38802/m.32752 type:complete len:87 (-) Transcript_38802:189-449(-)